MTVRHNEPDSYGRAIAAAREPTLTPEQVRLRVASVEALGRAQARLPRSRLHWPSLALGAALATAAAVAVVTVLPRAAPPVVEAPLVAPLQIGPAVAILPSAGASYAVDESNAASTQVRLRHGGLTVRLYSGRRDHALAVIAGDVVARARGTIYTVLRDTAGIRVYVERGEVEVSRASESWQVNAGQSWPMEAGVPEFVRESSQRLSEHVLAAEAPGPPPPAPPVAPEQPPEDLWRRARLLRGQGEARAAVRVLERLVERDDATWSPLALIEQMRIYTTELDDPARTETLAGQFLAGYADHRLAPDVRQLRCGAQRRRGTALAPECL